MRALLIRVMPLHEANTIMEQASLHVALMLFRSTLLQQRIKGLKIIVDAVNAVRVRQPLPRAACVARCYAAFVK